MTDATRPPADPAPEEPEVTRTADERLDAISDRLDRMIEPLERLLARSEAGS